MDITYSSSGAAQSPQSRSDERLGNGCAEKTSAAPGFEPVFVQEAPAERDNPLSEIPRFGWLLRSAIILGGAIAGWAAIWWLAFGRG